jgi:hypothetical protein
MGQTLRQRRFINLRFVPIPKFIRESGVEDNMFGNAGAKIIVFWWGGWGSWVNSLYTMAAQVHGQDAHATFLGKMPMSRLFVDFSGLVRVRNETSAAAGLVHASGADGNSLL